jgi:hypothetical protein
MAKSQRNKIQIGEMYKKVEGIGSSNNTYALVTGSHDNQYGTVVEYNVYSDSKLYANVGIAENIRMREEEFLTYYVKV